MSDNENTAPTDKARELAKQIQQLDPCLRAAGIHNISEYGAASLIQSSLTQAREEALKEAVDKAIEELLAPYLSEDEAEYTETGIKAMKYLKEKWIKEGAREASDRLCSACPGKGIEEECKYCPDRAAILGKDGEK